MKTGFVLTEENAAHVAAICARLEGLPLALELAAVRLRMFSPQGLLSRLDGQLGFLGSGARDLPARQQTLRAAIEWSYELLAPAEKELLPRLGVFVGGFTLAAVESVCGNGDSGDVIEALAGLLDQSLIRRDEHRDAEFDRTPGDTVLDDGAAEEEEPRFTMLETIREFAVELLEAMPNAGQWHALHAAYALKLMEHAEPDLREGTPVATMWRTRTTLQAESANLRAALAWAIAHGRGDDALALAGALATFWVPAGNLRVARRWRGQSSATLREARVALEQSLALDSTSRSARALALFGLGRVHLFQWDQFAAEFERAAAAFQGSLALYRELDDREWVGRCLVELGWLRIEFNDLAGAREHFEECLPLSRSVGDAITAGWCQIGLGRVAFASDEHDRAAAFFEGGLDEQRAAGNQLGMAGGLDGLGLVRQAQHRYPEALACFEEAVAVRRGLGVQSGLPIALQRLGVLLGAAGETYRAAELLRQSLTLSFQMENPWDIANALRTLGSLAAAEGTHERAARLFGAAEAFATAKRLEFPVGYQSLYGRSVAGVRRVLGEESFSAAFNEGAAAKLDDAVAEALLVGTRD